MWKKIVPDGKPIEFACGTRLLGEEIYLLKEPSGSTRVLFYKPVKVTQHGKTTTIKAGDKREFRVGPDGRFYAAHPRRFLPSVNKEQGMRLAYEGAGAERELFKLIVHDLALLTPPPMYISANEGWAAWRLLRWPEDFTKQFVPGVMAHACGDWGWLQRTQKKVENTAGNSNSKEPNYAYISLIYGERDPEILTPELAGMVRAQSRTWIEGENRPPR